MTRSFQGEVFLMGPNGEDPTRLIRREDLAIREMAWAPNGKFLLIGAIVQPNLGTQTLQAINVGTGDALEVMQDPRTFQHWRGYLPFYWLPDGRLLYARREPEPSIKTSNLWQIELDLESARVIGLPSQVTRLTGYNFRDLSATSDGSRLAFLLEENQADVYLGDLIDDGSRLTNVRRFTFDERDDYPAGWSPDGSEIYFQSDRGVSVNIFSKIIDGGRAQALGAGATESEDNVQQSPDKKWILYWDSGDLLVRTPVPGGPSELVLEGTSMSDFQCPDNPVISADCIVSLREPGNQYVFYTFNPEYGLGRKLLAVEDIPPFASWALSPDGSTVALVNNRQAVRIINLETGSEREFSEEGWVFGEFVDWNANGDALFMDGTDDGRSFKKSLIYYSPGRREAAVLREAPSQWHVVPKTSPDGKQLAFGLMIFSGNAWMIENP
jgi:hypothetical protein